MEVEYSLTLQDIDAFGRYHQKHDPWRKPRRLKMFLWSVAIMFLPLTVFFLVIPEFIPKRQEIDTKSGDAFWGGLAVGFLITTFLFVGIRIAVVIRSAKRLYDNEESRWVLGPRRMRISAEDISITHEFNHFRCAWATACWLGVTVDHAFFYTTRTQAHIVPRRAFADNQHFEEFVALARQYQQGQAPQGPKSTGILAGLPPEPTAITRSDAL